jgi:hypothetical protein
MAILGLNHQFPTNAGGPHPRMGRMLAAMGSPGQERGEWRGGASREASWTDPASRASFLEPTSAGPRCCAKAGKHFFFWIAARVRRESV